MSPRVKVLIVDDSAVIRQVLTRLLESDPDIEVVGTAADPYVAREKIKALKPDVLTLDIEMPRMDGIDFLRHLMRLRPMPVVMCSSLTQHGAEATLDALHLGAVDFIAKPRLDVSDGLLDVRREITTKVKAAARARLHLPLEPSASLSADAHSASRDAGRLVQTTDQVIAIGASTGGTVAVKELLQRFPADVPGIVIAQHIPSPFSAAFAKRLNGCCDLTVCEAQHDQPILAGHVYIAPGDRHLLVLRDGAHYRCRLSDTDKINHHRPSVDVLFASVAENVGRNAAGVMLTGMGRDGAAGMKAMRDAGATNVVQDEATSIVWGMPKAAWDLGAAQAMVPLPAIAGRVLALLRCRAGGTG